MLFKKIFTAADDLLCSKVNRKSIPFSGLEKSYTSSSGVLSVTELVYQDFSIFYGNASTHQQKVVHFAHHQDMVTMIFQFCGDIALRRNRSEEVFELKCNQQTIAFHPKDEVEIETTGCPAMHFFEVAIQPSFFFKYLPENKIFQHFILNAHRGIPTQIAPEHGNITSAMQRLVQDIVRCKKTGNLKKLFVESRVLELLLLQIEYYAECDVQQLQSIHHSHKDKILQAKKIIEENTFSPCSLIDLAHMVGTNECTLKKGFKEMTGNTVFGYWNDLKMDSAYRMITDTDMPVYEIAYHLGYKYPHHFTAAFKKKYNTTPAELRSSIHTKHPVNQE